MTLSFANIPKILRDLFQRLGFPLLELMEDALITGLGLKFSSVMVFVHFLRLSNILCNNEMKSALDLITSNLYTI